MDNDNADAATERPGTAQRVRVGLTGLAAIFLLVMGAAAGLRPAKSVAPDDAQGETLAVLGVAPSSGTPAALHKPADAGPVKTASRD